MKGMTDGKVNRWMLYIYIALVVGIPLGLLAIRLLTGGVMPDGWGWQMFSH